MIHCCFWWVHTDFQSEAVGAGCAPVMRLTCGSITKVMISFLDGEVTAADSSYQYGTVGGGGGERNSPEDAAYGQIVFPLFLILPDSGDG